MFRSSINDVGDKDVLRRWSSVEHCEEEEDGFALGAMAIVIISSWGDQQPKYKVPFRFSAHPAAQDSNDPGLYGIPS